MSVGQQFERLCRIMHRLRRDCPWDREQTHESLRQYLLEETYEVLHALDERRYHELCEELGDLMLQVVFHAEVAEEADRFDIGAVLREINEKLIRRHPHVFEDVEAETPEDVLQRWEEIKGREKAPEEGTPEGSGRRSALAGVPTRLPALLQAVRVLSKMRRAGVEPPALRDPADEAEKWLERLRRASRRAEPQGAERAVGMLGLCLVEMTRPVHVNPEDALRRTLGKLSRAFREEESRLHAVGRKFADLDPEELDRVADRLLTACREDTP